MALYRCVVTSVVAEWVGYVETDHLLDAIDIVNQAAPGPVVVDPVSTRCAAAVQREWGSRPFLGSNRTVDEWAA